MSQGIEVLATGASWPPTWAVFVAAFVLGSLVGSFLNVVIVRLPAGESIVSPGSHCPRCKTPIPAWLNVPVLSWALLAGRCRACRAPISVRYPLVELLTGLIFLATVRQFGVTLAALAILIMASGLVAITFIDLDCWEIPDEISIPLTLVGVVLRPFALDSPWYDGLVGALLGAGFLWTVRWLFFLVRHIEGMGLGDVKLIAMIGAFLGPWGTIKTILLASVSGTVIGGLFIIGRQIGLLARASPIPAPDPTPDPVPAADARAPDGGEREHSNSGDATSSATQDRPAQEDRPAEDSNEAWEPHPRAIPFGPFLAIGALGTTFFGSGVDRLLNMTTNGLERLIAPLLP